MSFELIQNQPIEFNEQTTCYDIDYIYNQIIKTSDTTMFQVKLNPCSDAPELITNGTFDTDVSSWSATLGTIAHFPVDDNWMKVTYGATGNCTVTQTGVYGAGGFYKLSLTIKGVSTTGLGLQVAIAGGSEVFQDLYADQEITLYHWVDSFEDLNLQFISGSNGDIVYIDNVSIQEIQTNHAVAIYNSDDTVYSVIYLNDELTSDDYLSSNYYHIQDNWLTVKLPWAVLKNPSGCYYIGLMDACTNSEMQLGFSNWTFNSQNGVTLATSTGISFAIDQANGILDLDYIGSPAGIASITFDELATVGREYQVEFKVSNSTGGTDVDFKLGGFTQSYAALADGTYNYTFTATGTSNIIEFDPTGANGALDLEYVKVRRGATDIDLNSSGYTSNSFNLGAHNCSIKLSVCQDENESFGFRWGASGFIPSLRVDYQLFNPGFPKERIINLDSEGLKQNIYYERRKTKQLVTKYVPEYLLDFLSSVDGYDHFYIDDTEYIVNEEDEINIRYDENLPTFGQVVMTVETQTQNFKNTKQSARGTGCASLTDCILDPVTEFCLIDPVTGESITAL